jgi:hypothetical protein
MPMDEISYMNLKGGKITFRYQILKLNRPACQHNNSHFIKELEWLQLGRHSLDEKQVKRRAKYVVFKSIR